MKTMIGFAVAITFPLFGHECKLRRNHLVKLVF
jgi:hypothetical protein